MKNSIMELMDRLEDNENSLQQQQQQQQQQSSATLTLPQVAVVNPYADSHQERSQIRSRHKESRDDFVKAVVEKQAEEVKKAKRQDVKEKKLVLQQIKEDRERIKERGSVVVSPNKSPTVQSPVVKRHSPI